jgi:hypothetical protein
MHPLYLYYNIFTNEKCVQDIPGGIGDYIRKVDLMKIQNFSSVEVIKLLNNKRIPLRDKRH